MKRWHPWATLQDLAGNLWCAMVHFQYLKQWQRKYPEWTPDTPIGQLMTDQIVCSCCGRNWAVAPGDSGKYVALTHRHLNEQEMRAYCKKCGWYTFPRNRSWTIPPCVTCGEGGGQVRFCSCGSLFDHQGPCQSKP
jgi:hypothetical protein